MERNKKKKKRQQKSHRLSTFYYKFISNPDSPYIKINKVIKMFAARRAAAQVLRFNVRAKHTLPDLPYDYAALEPIISRDIMSLHHSKHHNTYVTNLNVAEEKLQEALAKGDTGAAIALGPALKFNGGGHINHTIFWNNLSPNSSEPSELLCNAIKTSFGTMDKMKTELAAASVAIQGSGWGWLGWDKNRGVLRIATCANQDPLQQTTGLIPLLGIDVWEHAYYLQYKNVRPDYVKAIFDIVNWKDVSERLEKAKA